MGVEENSQIQVTSPCGMQFGWKGVGWQQWCSAGGAWATLNQVYEEQPHWIGVIVYVKKGVVCCSEAEAWYMLKIRYVGNQGADEMDQGRPD